MEENKNAITGLVLSILAFIFCWLPIVGVTLAIVSLIFNIKGLKGTDKGMAIGGIICAAIAIILNIIVTIIIVFYIAMWPTIKEDVFIENCENSGYYNEYTKCCTNYDGEISCLDD